MPGPASPRRLCADPLRRRLVGALTGTLALAAAAHAPAQEAVRAKHVAVLAPSTAAKEAVTLKPFFDEMRALGWVEGSTVVYERAYADDDHRQLPALATAVVARSPDVVYAPPQNAAVVAMAATSTIPIVFATGTDPVGVGLVQSLARPGGNVTGVSTLASTLLPKAMEVLRQVMPKARRMGILGDPDDPRWTSDRHAMAGLATTHGLVLVSAPAKGEREVEAAFAALVKERVDVVFTNSSLTFNARDLLVALARSARVPIVGHRAEFVDAGALFSYGPPLPAQIRRSAHLVDKVLRGGRPADMPVEQSTQIELVVNLRTAREFGFRFPPSVLARADRTVG